MRKLYTVYVIRGSEQRWKDFKKPSVKKSVLQPLRIMLKTVESAEKCFTEQLSRLRTDYGLLSDTCSRICNMERLADELNNGYRKRGVEQPAD